MNDNPFPLPLEVVGTHAWREVALKDGDLVPGEIKYSLTFQVKGQAIETPVTSSMYDAVLDALAQR